ncbi:hypothetical protein L1987_80828 [Smallanthus sonchifolius]|uniref:Uncharacterized protein n=1 Tax=Smallanthus sonchifolius TaxID=185202 RepID=A0ACB8YNQ7_9ASTR|nr:hypothetical protein L1987_80828 [Smallanthus sonchifolius]
MDYHRSAEVEVESSTHMVLEFALMIGGSLVTLLLRARAEVSYGGEEPGHRVVKVQGWCCIFVKLKLELAVSWCKQTPNVVQCSLEYPHCICSFGSILYTSDSASK